MAGAIQYGCGFWGVAPICTAGKKMPGKTGQNGESLGAQREYSAGFAAGAGGCCLLNGFAVAQFR